MSTIRYLTEVLAYLKALVAGGAEDERTLALIRETEYRLRATKRRPTLTAAAKAVLA